MTSLRVIVELDTDDPEFVRGFEAGLFFAQFRDQPVLVEMLCHESNRNLFVRLGASNRYDVDFEEVGDEMLRAIAVPSKTVLTLV